MIQVKIEAFIKARIKAGLGQREMGRKLGKSSGYISLVESGQCSVSPQSAKDICELLDMEFDELFEIRHSASHATSTA